MLKIYSLAIALMLSAPFNGDSADTALEVSIKEKFATEAQASWRDLRKSCTNLRAEVRDSSEWPANSDRPPRSEISTIKYNGHQGCILFDLTSVAGENAGEQVVIAANPDYGFKAVRTHSGGVFQIRYLDQSEDGLARVTDSLREGYVVFAPLLLHHASLDSVFSESSTTIQDIKPVESSTEDLVRIDFTSLYTPRENYTVVGGQVICDPSNKWAWRHFKMRVRDDENEVLFHSGELQYQNSQTALVPKTLVHEIRREVDGPFTFQRRVDYRDVRQGDIRCDKCTLAAVSLPDPAFRVARHGNSSTFLAINIVALIFGAFAFFVWRLSRKRSVA